MGDLFLICRKQLAWRSEGRSATLTELILVGPHKMKPPVNPELMKVPRSVILRWPTHDEGEFPVDMLPPVFHLGRRIQGVVTAMNLRWI